jgi:hypothetical protein
MYILAGFMASNVMAKEFEFNTTLYGAYVSQASTGSGYGNTVNMNLNVQKNQRLFELGIMLSSQNQHFMGLSFNYKHFIGFRKSNFAYKTVYPYFHYNFLYRTPEEIIVNPLALAANPGNPNLYGGKMTTIEHAIGFGLQVKLIQNFYMDGNAGFGIYLGSKYQGMHPHTWGIHNENSGWVPSIKLGIGYKF